MQYVLLVMGAASALLIFVPGLVYFYRIRPAQRYRAAAEELRILLERFKKENEKLQPFAVNQVHDPETGRVKDIWYGISERRIEWMLSMGWLVPVGPPLFSRV